MFLHGGSEQKCMETKAYKVTMWFATPSSVTVGIIVGKVPREKKLFRLIERIARPHNFHSREEKHSFLSLSRLLTLPRISSITLFEAMVTFIPSKTIRLLQVVGLLFALLMSSFCSAVRGNIGGANGRTIRDAIGIDVFGNGGGPRRTRRKRQFINVDDNRGPEKLRTEDFFFDEKSPTKEPVSVSFCQNSF